MKLEYLLLIGGVLHFVILVASAATPRVLDWRANLAGLTPFLRRLFWVYGVFIFLVILGFGLLATFNARAMATGDPLARSVAGLIAIFWLTRLLVQFVVFGQPSFLTTAWLRCGYHGLTVLFALLVAIFGWAAVGAVGP